jgi:uncharacterized membrane protein YdjX (TVP38/TMEM64 family)
MKTPVLHLRAHLARDSLWPSLRTGLWILALFVAATWLARHYAAQVTVILADHARLGIAAFVASSAIAVLMPALTNLPLVPLASLAWGPWWTAVLLLLGWVLGAALSFSLARFARQAILTRFPSVQRHADIDRLIHPGHRLASLILLRMTFPVDVLSYALGLFSRDTTLRENALSTALGAAPFALFFACFPTLPVVAQLVMLAASVLAFAGYVFWMLRHPSEGDGQA